MRSSVAFCDAVKMSEDPVIQYSKDLPIDIQYLSEFAKMMNF